jgi:hypothetical protein
MSEFDQQYPVPLGSEAEETPFHESKPNGHIPNPPHNPAPTEGRAAKLRKKRASSANPEGGVSNDSKIQTKLEVRTSNKKWWYRAHRDAEFQIPVELLVIEGGRDEGTWLLEPDVEFSDELSQHIVPAILTRCITSDGTEFLFLAKQTEKSPRSSTRRLISEAREKWIQSTWNGNSKSYDFRYASQLRREPVWPEKTIDELIDLGFDGFIINNPNHEVVNRLLWPDDEDGVSQ